MKHSSECLLLKPMAFAVSRCSENNDSDNSIAEVIIPILQEAITDV
jgi:hypothetical protein